MNHFLFHAPAVIAYIDPGTGSMLLQILVASVLGTVMAFRRFRERIFGFFSRNPAPPKADADAQHEPIASVAPMEVRERDHVAEEGRRS